MNYSPVSPKDIKPDFNSLEWNNTLKTEYKDTALEDMKTIETFEWDETFPMEGSTASSPDTFKSPEAIEWNKNLTIKLIEEYRKLPCLWQRGSDSYRDKDIKTAGYTKLLAELQVIRPECTLEDIKRKINTLRSQHRREMKLRKASNNSDRKEASARPKLWCFKYLSFLNHDRAGKSTSRLDAVSDHDLDNPDEDDVSDMSLSSACPEDTAEHASVSARDPLDISELRKKKRKPYTSDEGRRRRSSKSRSRSLIASTSSTTIAVDQLDDDCACFGKLLTLELRKMDDMQRHIAKKLVSDIVFYANMKSLAPTAKVLPESQ